MQAVDSAGNRGPISNAARASIAREGESVIEGIAEIDSEDGHAFTVIVQDNGDPGKDLDWFEITLDTGYQAGGLLSSGNIKIHYTPLEVAAPPSAETQTTWQLLFGLDGLNFLLGLL
ncbi:MAG: hypothetical protein HYZ00_08630 [Candidatus Hydrogenedentes bacterium]|nr:hypothetical protein [Candidatus Hydrogenedentota bacterium]